MTQVIIDEALRSKLHRLSEPLELCEPSGRVVARVFPVLDLSNYELVEPPIDEEEMRRREQETESYSTAEMLAYLESLPCSESDGNAPRKRLGQPLDRCEFRGTASHHGGKS